uniref:Glycoprotein n=1 Tax=Thogotovirus thogotoense TaxID=11569 RepID=A0A7M1I6T9_9ORTO|nr:glycoprotein [Thogotovirus thogotoense]
MFLQTALLLLSLGVAEPDCNTKTATGPYILDRYKPKPVTVSKKLYSATRYTTSAQNELLTAGYRTAWVAYCYNGGLVDSNTGCNARLLHYPPSRDELLLWGSSHQCSYGDICHDCWGSDSYACLGQLDPAKHWAPRKELVRRDANWKFAYHMCNIDWRCGVTTSPVFFNLQWVKNEVKVSTLLPNGSTVEHSAGEPLFWTEKDFSYLVKDNFEIQREEVKISCFVDPDYWVGERKTKKAFCQDGTNFFEVTSHQFCHQYACYNFSKDELLEAVYKERAHEKSKDLPFGNKSWTVVTASIDDLHALSAAQAFELEGLRASFAELDSRFRQLSEILDTVISSIAKIDERLIGRLIKAPVSSRFISEDKFLLHQCVDSVANNTNCVGDSAYVDGRWTHVGDNHPCTTVVDEPIGIDIYNFSALWYPSAAEVDFRGTVQSEDGWSFVVKSKDALIQTMMYTKNGGKGTSLTDLLDYPSGWLKGQLGGLLYGNIGVYLLIAFAFVLLIRLIKSVGLC